MGEMGSQAARDRRSDSSSAAVGFVALYALIIMLPLIVSALTVERNADSFIKELSLSFALVGFAILAMQPVMAARLRTITHHYGFDMVMRFHKAMAVVAVLLLLSHPILLAINAGSPRLLISLEVSGIVWFGRIGLLLLLIMAIASIWQRRLLDFQRWRLGHNSAPIILVLVFVHSWILGYYVQDTPMQTLWVVLLGAAVVAYVMHKVVWPLRRKANLWNVRSVKQETHNAWTLEIEPPEGTEPLEYEPGQFQFLTLYRGDDRYDGEEHHFTISSSPTSGPTHTSTIKVAGDFTSTIGETKDGDKAMVQAPFGRFSYTLNEPGDRFLMIAGGIGITPLMSNLRHMRDVGLDVDVTLLYANDTEADIVFREELDEIAAGEKPRFRVVHVLSEEDWDGRTGRVDRDLIADAVGDDLSRHMVYLCGPEDMMNELMPVLEDMGVTPDRLYNERFWL